MFYVDVILFGVDEGTASTCTVDALCMVRILILSKKLCPCLGDTFYRLGYG